MRLHSCTMFCECDTARHLTGGTAAERAGTPRRADAPRSPREAATRVAQEQARTTTYRDTRGR